MTNRPAKFLTTLIRQCRMQRKKAHGSGRVPVGQALFFAWVGAWIASHRLGPNPSRILQAFGGRRS